MADYSRPKFVSKNLLQREKSARPGHCAGQAGRLHLKRQPSREGRGNVAIVVHV